MHINTKGIEPLICFLHDGCSAHGKWVNFQLKNKNKIRFEFL